MDSEAILEIFYRLKLFKFDSKFYLWNVFE